MADAKIITLCDQLVTTLEAAWPTRGADDLVRRVYLAPVNLDRAEPWAGRRVYLFPAAYRDDPATRAEDSREYTVGVWVAERYPDEMAADSDDCRDWLDERVGFVETQVYDALDFGRRDKTPKLQFDGRRVWTDAARVTAYDWERLNALELFLSQLEFTFRELVN